jgi:hypothetical protein
MFAAVGSTTHAHGSPNTCARRFCATHAARPTLHGGEARTVKSLQTRCAHRQCVLILAFRLHPHQQRLLRGARGL